MEKRWKILPSEPELQKRLTEELGLSPLLAQLLINREITEPQQADKFLNSTLSDLHSPFLMEDMDKAVDRVISAIKNRERVCIYGDYDVDGITSTALLKIFLSETGNQPLFYFPHRLNEGRGLNPEALDRLSQQGVKLIITVDCGISDNDQVAYANRLGIDVIITDHHEVPEELPAARAILDPWQKGCKFPYKTLAGVGVTFNLVIALRTRLREEGFFGDREVPNLKHYLDLVALGTVADIVPLTDENRIFVRYGLEQLTAGRRAGIRALKEVSGCAFGTVDTVAVAYRLAPRINAAGRISQADEGFKLLATSSEEEALSIARKLNEENSQRQQIEESILKAALLQVEADARLKAGASLVLDSPDWHPGVVGIAASRLTNEYFKPTILIAVQEGVGKGSARSIPGFDIYQGIKSCQDLLKTYGGHRWAAGLTIMEDKIDEFRNRFERIVSESLSEEDLISKLSIDALLPLPKITEKLIEELNLLEPYGAGNPEPVFATTGLKLMDSWIVGNNHLKLKIKEKGRIYSAIGFRMADRYPLPSAKVDLAFVPQFNEWEGVRSIQLKVKDVRTARSASS
ncbi:MAG: single-stranded-DNA-specific exonuclease RecJ [Deltaproteobacteria bacterium]|nr:MAG: single-stranded-DNA-specific exonuclease RecJ [Deltaproteobacteria bacterium]